MIKLQTFSDKAAIGLSLMCTIHCLAFPLLFVVFPSMASFQLDNEVFHFRMLLAVMPTSIYALTLGCKRHKRLHLLVIGLLGLTVLLLTAILPEPLLSESAEKLLTLVGAMLIGYGHVKNYRLCQYNTDCKCHEQELSKPHILTRNK